ncbi:MAG TPA: hypothetical protein V6C52_10220 [Coleofasciculaceae cyanobacterium]|jgi:hypothetical protein
MNFSAPTGHSYTNPKFGIKIPPRNVAVLTALLAAPIGCATNPSIGSDYTNRPEAGKLFVHIQSPAALNSNLFAVIKECKASGGQLNGPKTVADQKTGQILPLDVYECKREDGGELDFRAFGLPENINKDFQNKTFLGSVGGKLIKTLYTFKYPKDAEKKSAPVIINSEIKRQP